MENLIKQLVQVLTDTTKAPNDFGVLIKINNKGNYPYIIRFSSGSEYGVNNIAPLIEDSALEIESRNFSID